MIPSNELKDLSQQFMSESIVQDYALTEKSLDQIALELEILADAWEFEPPTESLRGSYNRAVALYCQLLLLIDQAGINPSKSYLKDFLLVDDVPTELDLSRIEPKPEITEETTMSGVLDEGEEWADVPLELANEIRHPEMECEARNPESEGRGASGRGAPSKTETDSVLQHEPLQFDSVPIAAEFIPSPKGVGPAWNDEAAGFGVGLEQEADKAKALHAILATEEEIAKQLANENFCALALTSAQTRKLFICYFEMQEKKHLLMTATRPFSKADFDLVQSHKKTIFEVFYGSSITPR